jgi:hypothetical protein
MRQVLPQHLVLLPKVRVAQLQLKFELLAVLRQLVDLLLLLGDLLVKAGLEVVALLLELLFEVVELLGRLFLADHGLPLRRLDRSEHAVVVALLVLTLVAFLVELDLQELQLLVVNSLVLLELGLEVVVLLLDLFEQQLEFSDLLSLLNALRLLLLVVRRDLVLELRLQLLVLLLDCGC